MSDFTEDQYEDLVKDNRVEVKRILDVQTQHHEITVADLLDALKDIPGDTMILIQTDEWGGPGINHVEDITYIDGTRRVWLNP